MRIRSLIPSSLRFAAAVVLLLLTWACAAQGQETSQKPAEKRAAKPVEKPASSAPAQNPAQIELLETKIRFETNGDSRKEVHARVHINTELGVRQFAQLNFQYNRSFESIDIPLVHITHTTGGSAHILPSAITDTPDPAAINAPAYQDVRVKSVRILGLEPGDLLEYRVTTTSSHHPLAPDFYLSHDFARGGIATQELFEINLPASRNVKPLTSKNASDYETDQTSEGGDVRVIYRWRRPSPASETAASQSPPSSKMFNVELPTFFAVSDVALTTFPSWGHLQGALRKSFEAASQVTSQVNVKAKELTHNATTPQSKLHALYNFVSQKISTIDLPLDSTGFRSRSAETVLSSGYATPEEKCTLLYALAKAVGVQVDPVFTILGAKPTLEAPVPSLLDRVLLIARFTAQNVWLDPSLEVAPFGVIASNMRGKPALPLYPTTDIWSFEDIPSNLPFAASQRVDVDAILAADGKLTAKIHYSMRGDNELLLRVAFHQTPKEKWRELAQLLSLSDGFRGQVSSINASDPYATKEPFTVEYEITQPKFVDWSKKPVRIPALLPQLGLPEPPAKATPGAAVSPIELGTPLEVETRMTLRLPPGTSATTPTGTSVERDYATYSSRYAANGLTLAATRHINFLLRQIPGARAADYNAFLHTVQNDEAQDFSLERTVAPPRKAPSPNP